MRSRVVVVIVVAVIIIVIIKVLWNVKAIAFNRIQSEV